MAMMYDTVQKVARHARAGTLFTALVQRLRTSWRGERANPDHYHGDVARNYLQKRLQQKSWHVEQDIVQELLTQFPDGAKVLDVPFGTGRFVDMYLAKGMDVYGVDISEDMLATAREVLGAAYDRCKIHVGSAEDLPYEDNLFDLVVCFRFFGLISFEMAEKVLSEIHRVVRGHAIIRVPVRDETATEVRKPKRHESVQGKMQEGQMLAMFEKYGFKVSAHRLIEKRQDVRYMVYLLTKRTG